jgi:hypothetical protein
MGLCGYLRKFNQNFSKLAKCLHKLGFLKFKSHLSEPWSVRTTNCFPYK